MKAKGTPKEFKTILVDPAYAAYGGGKYKRGADAHYPVLTFPEMLAAIARSGLFLPANDAHLYVWVPNNFIPMGLELVSALGFRYVTTITWAKRSFGGGQYFRGQTEQLLFGVHGRGLRLRREWTARRDLSTLLEADHERDERNQRIHSAKPQASYELIEAASPAPRLELFARRPREGWTVWGDEISERESATSTRSGERGGRRS